MHLTTGEALQFNHLDGWVTDILRKIENNFIEIIPSGRERSCATHSNASVVTCRSKDSMDFSSVDFSLTGKFAAMHPAYPLIDSNCKAQKLFAMWERIVD